MTQCCRLFPVPVLFAPLLPHVKGGGRSTADPYKDSRDFGPTMYDTVRRTAAVTARSSWSVSERCWTSVSGTMAPRQLLMSLLLGVLLLEGLTSATAQVPPGELHCSKGGAWCPTGETCGGPVCGPGPRCCNEAVDFLLQKPITPETSSSLPVDVLIPPSEETPPEPPLSPSTESPASPSTTPPGDAVIGDPLDSQSRPSRRRRPESSPDSRPSSPSPDRPSRPSRRRRPESGPEAPTDPSEGGQSRPGRRRRPSSGRPGPSGPSEPEQQSSRGRRRCRPGTKCPDNFPCEQGGSACPSGQTCGGECGPNTCCRRRSSQCGEGGDVCPSGFTCGPCPLPGGACCFPSCDRPDAYIAEPCGVEGICLPCEAASERLCCRRQPNTLEDCRRHCRRERGKECYLFGCPKGAGWCCRNPTPL
ncbi:kielin/chordin-like protein isoform X3 [Amphibalanus amphitrite]|uniref:kielin/chordin-like protein isoform X3 n=1 Tax=Amphibalanus amphitrite TaxID=1232801 RepID=UPI001C91A43B|nr:kielin/chordin-like protein isoform X3 [Amphibalanus amphitrite]